MIGTLTLHTFRECFRTPFPYVAAVVVVLVTVASKLFLAFSFGADQVETINLAVSAVFLAGFLHAAFLGSTLVRRDVERGTLALVLTKPVSSVQYLLGRFLGLFLSAIALCLVVAWCVAGIFFLLPSGGEAPLLGAELLLGWLRAFLPLMILDAAAIAVSAAVTRVAAPIALIALFLAGSLVSGSAWGLLLPDFGVFGLEAGASPSLPLLAAYATLFSSIFLILAYIVLASKSPLRSRG